MTDPRLAAFLSGNARLVAPPLVPELRVWTADALAPFWEAAEATFGPLEPPFWGYPWPGSQGLARYILDHPAHFAGRRVLDVGAGGGLAAIAVARVGGVGVANDIDPLALVAARHNAAANGVVIEVRPGDLSGEADADADVVIVGDVCYERDGAAALLAWLGRLARTRPVYVADPGRAFAPSVGVTSVARYRVATTMDLEDRVEREVHVLALDGGPIPAASSSGRP